MRLVLDDLDVCRLNGWTKFGFENVAAVCLEQLVLAVEPWLR
jgi:hypothetical protein